MPAHFLATPFFGFALSIPSIAMPIADVRATQSAMFLAPDPVDQAPDATPPDASVATASTEPPNSVTEPVATSATENPTEASPTASMAPASPVAPNPNLGPSSDAEYGRQLRQRNELRRYHRIFGIATWASMAATLALGTIQYYNLYGFGEGIGSNPCVLGTAIPDQGACTGRAVPHAIAAGVTSLLYFTTFTLSLFMPDPDRSDEGSSAFADRLRAHKILRWIHLGGMIAQIVLGAVMGSIGVNRSENYGAAQALATTHLALGYITFGTLTAAGALMTF